MPETEIIIIINSSAFRIYTHKLLYYELLTYACVLDSERSHECIDFTILCAGVFFVSAAVDTFSSRKNASITNIGGGFW